MSRFHLLPLLAFVWALAGPPAQSQNLLTNPNFDLNLDGWTPAGGTTFSFDASQGSPDAGSFAATLTGGVGVGIEAPVAGQCVPVSLGRYEASGRCRLDSAASSGYCKFWFNLYSDVACVTQVNSTPGGHASASSTTWSSFLSRLDVPAGVQSVRVSPTLTKEPSVASSAAHFDTLVFRRYAKGDLSGDGRTDLFLSNAGANQNRLWTMDGVVRTSTDLISPDPPSSSWRLAVMDDFDWDGLTDLVFQNTVSGAVQFWMMNGLARTGSAVALANSPSADWRLVAAAPLRPYSGSHLVWQNTVTRKLSVWLMSGSTFHNATKVPSPDQAADANWELVAAADFNADLDTDFLWYNQSTGKTVLWFLDRNLVRQTGQFTNPSNAGDNNWKVVAGGDYGVGTGGLANTNDLVWRNATSGKLVVWYLDTAGNRTAGTFTTPDSPSNALAWTVAGPR